MPDTLETAFRDAPPQEIRDFALGLFLQINALTTRNTGAVTEGLIAHAIDAMLDRTEPTGDAT